ncbi:ABC transporter substrate-binding protein [Skermanella aerolata]|uniref:ABC transporter substrate-binding protein n=1 Tax=Skermanella aerolata TaxID=393310 RepID=A0A512DTP3_9PROT|nr:TRAP transporter substrate-binding protein [Skermanella aerolata]KJB92093.1 ABC transporter substrate-binding protein [Skermanella aerolata KACC 11604]GEO39843.1 ABC transporter substrate-binding protein [Skermanella aerolata]
MNKKILSKKNIRAFGIGIGLLFATAGAQAQDFKERTLRFAFQNTADHPVGLGLAKFSDLVKQKSGSKITVKLFPGGTLGGDLQTVSALQGGTLDLTVLNTGVLAGIDKNTAILDFPYLFNSEKEADAVVDGPAGKKLHELLSSKGLIGLSYFENGFRQVTNSRHPVAKLEDFQGLRLRVLQLPLFIDIFKELGVNPVPLPFPELYPALEQKVVDGQENPINTIYYSKIHEVQKYVSLTRHVFNPQSVLIGKKTWDRFSQDEKSAIQEAAYEAAVYQRQVSREQTVKSLEAIKQAGVAVNDVSPAEVERIKEKIKPVIDRYTKDLDQDLVQEVNAEIAKVRAGN